MLAYGNMSQTEKQMNKSDLQAYKNYESVNYNMVPGIQPNSQLKRFAPPSPRARKGERLQGSQSVEVMGPSHLDSPMRREREQVAKLQNDRLQHYGAQHLGPQLNTIEGPKRLRGEGGLINKDF